MSNSGQIFYRFVHPDEAIISGDEVYHIGEWTEISEFEKIYRGSYDKLIIRRRLTDEEKRGVKFT